MRIEWTEDKDRELRRFSLLGYTEARAAIELGCTTLALGSRASVLQVTFARLNGKAHAGRHTSETLAKRSAQMLAFRRMQRGKKHPMSLADMKRIADASTVTVTQCPTGQHAGWTPAWTGWEGS
jgi:hypothetical protein